MNQGQLATAAGIKQPSLSELETGETKEISGPTLIALAKALKVRPEWLVTGEEPIELPLTPSTPDEREMLDRYRKAMPPWKLTLRLLAALPSESQSEVSESMNVVLAKIAATPVPDARLGNRWTRPDKRKGKP